MALIRCVQISASLYIYIYYVCSQHAQYNTFSRSVPRLALRFFSLRTTFVIYDYSINRNVYRSIWTWLRPGWNPPSPRQSHQHRRQRTNFQPTSCGNTPPKPPSQPAPTTVSTQVPTRVWIYALPKAHLEAGQYKTVSRENWTSCGKGAEEKKTWLQQTCTCVIEMIIRTLSFNHMNKKMLQRIRTVFPAPWRRV